MEIKGIKEDVKYYLHGGISRMIEQKRIERYASIIWSEIIEENKKMYDTTMMIKTPRKSNELTTNRMTHQNKAAGLAMIVADKLGLNTRIVEIAAQNHDLGHTPYGHSMEWWESEIFKDIGMGYRCHNAIGTKRLMYSKGMQDRIIDRIKEYNPKLSDKKLDKIRKSLWLVLDPILCHNGESSKQKLCIKPNLDKTEKDFEKELKDCYIFEGIDRELVPATAEGALFRPVDVMSYVGSDMADGLKEGIITGLDDEYREILGQIGITSDEIDLLLAKKAYDELARRVEMNLCKDLIENSNKNMVKWSPEKTELVSRLRNKNNKEIVDKVVRPTEAEVYPKATRKILNDLSGIISEIGKQDLEGIMNYNKFDRAISQRKIEELQEKYKDCPYSGFVTYLCNMRKEDYSFIIDVTNSATYYSTIKEVEEAMTESAPKNDKYSMRNARIQEMIDELKSLYPNGVKEEYIVNYARQYIRDNMSGLNPNFLSMDKRIGIALGADYIESLNDKEFIKLLEDTKILSEEELKDIHIKYNELSDEELGKDTRQDAWKEISKRQSEGR